MLLGVKLAHACNDAPVGQAEWRTLHSIDSIGSADFQLCPAPQRNYRWFLCFVFSTTLLCVWVFALSLVHLLKYTDDSGRDFGHAIRKHPASLVCMIYTFLAFW